MPIGGPVIAQPTMAGEIGQAAGQFPQLQQDYQLKQAEIDATNMDNASKRLSVLTKMFSTSPGAAQNPQLMQATQRAFQSMGLSAPMTTVNGKQQLDVNALSAFGPAMDFMSQNLGTILALPPGSRAATVEAITGQQLAPELEAKLGSLPQRTMTSNDLGPLLTTVRNSVLSLGKPGGSIDNVIATIKSINPLLEQLGTSVNVDDLAPDIYAMELQSATLKGLDAKTAKANADADLAKAKAAIQPELGQAAVTSAGAKVTAANAQASRAATYASLEPSTAAKNQATATKDVADAKKDAAEVQDIQGSLSGSGGSGKGVEQHLQRLTTIANQSQALYERHLQDYQTLTAEAAGEQDPGTKAQLEQQAAQEHEAASQAHITAQRAQQALSTYQSKTTHAVAPPADMKPNTVEYYNHLDAADKQKYLNNPNVPADVRAYLKTLQQP